ncbi:DNA repair protein complementing XP-C cells homolog isoform X1 [Anneissia japonica]|uniref:DNA repair protein complementing XP-C cells homolog isoform X1 n=1 Tax=Anneissia japonica TaxID=1529436 RepID=UPI00142563DB|nr:DNA repair protein complementing XP-C cells homolog isoform X1 [Anneissia japonica]
MGKKTNRRGSKSDEMPGEHEAEGDVGLDGEACKSSRQQGKLRRSKRCNSPLDFQGEGASKFKKTDEKSELDESEKRKQSTRGRKRITSTKQDTSSKKKKLSMTKSENSRAEKMNIKKCNVKLSDVKKSRPELIKENELNENQDALCSKKKESKEGKQNKNKGVKNKQQIKKEEMGKDILSLDKNSKETETKKETLVKEETNDGSEESDEDDWEEVEELDSVLESPVKSTVTNKTIEITLDNPNQAKKRKKEDEWEAYFRREINRHNREQQITFHKAHLLCLLALGQYCNSVCSNMTLQALCMSVIPNKFSESGEFDIAFLIRFVRWFQSLFKIMSTTKEDNYKNFDEVLCSRFEKFEAANETEFVHIFASLLRCLQLNVRVVFSLQPVPIKTENVIKKVKQKSSKDEAKSKPSKAKQPAATKHTKKVNNRCKLKIENADLANGALLPSRQLRTKNESRRTSASKVVSKDGGSTDVIVLSEDNDSERDLKVNNDRDSDENWTFVKSGCSTSMDSDSDFEPEVTNTSRGPKLSAKKKSILSKKGVLFNSEKSVEVIGEKKKTFQSGSDVWVEVFLESNKKWVCIDCMRSILNCPGKCEKYATQPLVYVLAFSKDGSIKDLTQKYASKWTHTMKLRIDYIEPKWWQATLKPFRTKDKKQEETEDRQLQESLLNKPMPTSINDFKNHPLYALKRHLLKFQAIYPESATILGYCRGEAVYSRDCVHELHAKEAWMKQARVVRIGEEPYKIVKARPKLRQKKTGESPPPLPIYGYWQTEEYMAMPAVDGKIPRNEHGNVELYKPCMLPAGTVHIQINGLNKVARKLDIDCVPAVVGWDFHCGFSHPVFDGFVVCEEFKEILVEAWEHEQVQIEKKQKEKREQRALKNWRHLTKALLIRERLKRRYQSSYEDPDLPTSQNETVADVNMSWPMNRNMQSAKDTTHLFPFEKL